VTIRLLTNSPVQRSLARTVLAGFLNASEAAPALCRLSILLGVVLLSGCQSLPGPFAPPEQRQPFDNFAPYRVHKIVDMGEPDANQHIVTGIVGDTGPWRWTNKRVEVRVFLRTNQMLRYVIDFSIVDATFKDTGPLEFSFYVNGHVVDHRRYTSPGSEHFEKPIPEDWVEPGKDAIVGAEVDKVWVSPADHQPLGFVLTRMGLLQE